MTSRIEEAVDKLVGEARPVYTADVIRRISDAGIFEKRVSTWYVADGTAALFRDKDGQAYEVLVSPASLAKYKELYPGGKRK
jgi:hypothetical protein